VKMVLSCKILLSMRTIHMWRSRTPAGIRCVHFASVITTIMDHKLQFLKPLNKRELYTTQQNLIFQNVSKFSKRKRIDSNNIRGIELKMFLSHLAPRDKVVVCFVLLVNVVDSENMAR
jgi:hypothetical protein